MTYFRFEVTVERTGKVAPSVGTYTDNNDEVAKQSAEAAYHKRIGTVMDNPSMYKSILTHVVREDGYVIEEPKLFTTVLPDEGGEA